MRPWRRLRADLARPEVALDPQERGVLLLGPLVILALAQLSDGGSGGDLLLAGLAVVAFALRVLVPRLPAEVFAVLVIVPVGATVGRDGVLEGTFFLVVTMVLYTAWSLPSVGRAVLILAAAAALPWFVARHLTPASDIAWTPWTMASFFTFALGRTLQRQRGLIEQLEAARQALADRAVAEERRRIARELHDVAGHTLAAMLLHVTGARHVLRRDPDDAERALRDAESVGRSSLEQIRATVAALRTDERGTEPALPGSGDLPDLLEEYRRAGLSVTADIGGSAAAIDGPVGTALHRIAREALANVARHARGNQVEVLVERQGRTVRLVVTDRGRPGPSPDPHGLHFGLVGMAERARALGGQLEAGPTEDGWQVEAVLPMAGVEPEPLPR